MHSDNEGLFISTAELSLSDKVNDLDEFIAQCELNASQYYQGTPQSTMASLRGQIEDIEESIKRLSQEEPGYPLLPEYQRHCDAVKKIKESISKHHESKEIAVKDSDEAILPTEITKLLHVRLLAEGFHPQKSSDPFEFIARSSHSQRLTLFLEGFYSALLPEQKQLIVEKLVPQYIIIHTVSETLDFFDPLIKIDMKEMDNWIIVGIAKGLGENPGTMAQKFQVLMEEKSVYKKDLLMEFMGYGNVTKLGGLLTCAQLSSRKSYPINSTVLEKDELKDYFILIQKDSAPSRVEHFLLVDTHWLSGVTEKLPNGKIRMLVIEVLGKEYKREYCQLVTDAFFNVFPKGEVFRNNEKLQRTKMACAIFSLEHLRHFPKTGSYLDMPLLQYFSDQKTEKKSQGIEENRNKVKFCHLPLPLLRTMEDNALHKEIIPGRDEKEKGRSIIRKGKNAEKCVEQDFKFVPEVGSLRNQRIGVVKDKFFTHNQKFMSLHSDEEIKKKMQNFTLDGFRQRITSSNNEQEERTELTGIARTRERYQSAYNHYQFSFEPGPARQMMRDTGDDESIGNFETQTKATWCCW